jgi:hypothetical protein
VDSEFYPDDLPEVASEAIETSDATPAEAASETAPETAPEAVSEGAPETGLADADAPELDDAAPPVLADLIAAGLVSHELIGDPAQLGGEANGLRALCALVAGPVYRIEAYHYAFRAGPGDLDGQLGELAPGEWTAVLEDALCATLGPDAVWLNATDLLPEAEAALAQPLLLLRAHDAAVTGALEGAGPELQAVISARYAAACARLTLAQAAASGAEGPLADRLAAIEARQDDILARLEAQDAAAKDAAARRDAAAETDDAVAARLDRLAETMAAILDRLEARDAVLADQGEVVARFGERLDALQGGPAAPAAFQETIGVTLAEFLARIEQRADEDRAGLRVPQFN